MSGLSVILEGGTERGGIFIIDVQKNRVFLCVFPIIVGFFLPGLNASIVCHIGSVPASHVRWFHVVDNRAEIINNSAVTGGGDGGDDASRRLLLERGRFDKEARLLLTNVRVEDSGQYACVAENQAGRAEANFTLQVRTYIYMYILT